MDMADNTTVQTDLIFCACADFDLWPLKPDTFTATLNRHIKR